MNRQIVTEDDYRKALRRFLEIIEAPSGSKERMELCELMEFLRSYETENCP